MRRSPPLKPGTYVKFKGNLKKEYRNPVAIVIEHQHEGAIFLQTEGSDRMCVARHEISVLRQPPETPLRPMRHQLPYGKWTCTDGRQVLFNRDYKPIWQRRPSQAAASADQGEWVQFQRQEWFYTDANQPWRCAEAERKCIEVLKAWGVSPPWLLA